MTERMLQLAALVGATVLVLLCVLFVRAASTSGKQLNGVEPVTIAVATDLHYLSPSLTDHGAYFEQMIRNADGKVMEYSEELIDAFVQQIITQQPDVLILSGDLTFNGEYQSHADLSIKLKQITDAGIRVLVIPGNHDLDDPMAASFQGDSYRLVDSISSDQFAELYQDFGYGDALATDPASLSYMAELSPGLRVLMVDVNTAEAPGQITAETLNWVRKQLADAAENGARVLAVSHQNMLQHNTLFQDGFVMGNREELIALYERYNVICNLSGHMHIQHFAQRQNGLTEIVTSSLAVPPDQYGILRLDGTSADYQTVTVDVSGWAAEQQSDNNDLLDFTSYAKAFMQENALRQTAAELEGNEDAEQMALFFAEVNAAYFAGRLDQITWNDTLYEAWQTQGGFSAAYLSSIAADMPNNYTALSFGF